MPELAWLGNDEGQALDAWVVSRLELAEAPAFKRSPIEGFRNDDSYDHHPQHGLLYCGESSCRLDGC